jgi:hypothetical protein
MAQLQRPKEQEEGCSLQKLQPLFQTQGRRGKSTQGTVASIEGESVTFAAEGEYV